HHVCRRRCNHSLYLGSARDDGHRTAKYLRERMGRVMASVSSSLEPQVARSTSWRDIKITRTMIFSVLFIIAGIVLLVSAPPNMTDETVTTLTFGDPRLPAVAVPTLLYTIIVAAYYTLAGIVGLLP